MDNLSSHKGAKVRQLIEAAGASLLHLPPRSPDFNPIENAFAKIKALLLAPLDAFAAGPWGCKYPAIAPAWPRNWDKVIPFFAFPEAVRRIVYTTNAIEALNAKLRRAISS
jgi:transposase-like protein